MNIRIKFAKSLNDFNNVKILFQEYANSLDFSLSFQDFNEELENIPGKYSTPRGCIILAWDDLNCVGCVAMRPLNNRSCEIKRLYVKNAYRGQGIGKLLTDETIKYCKKMKYTKICLDTLNRMQRAIGIYKSLGFVESSPYYDNPLPEAKFFELNIENKNKYK